MELNLLNDQGQAGAKVSAPDEIFARDEIDAALLLFKKHRKDAPALGSTPLLGTMVDIIARLGGYIGKSS